MATAYRIDWVIGSLMVDDARSFIGHLDTDLKDDQRAHADLGYQRQFSVFPLGWRWLRRVLRLADIPKWNLTLHPFQPERVAATCWVVSRYHD